MRLNGAQCSSLKKTTALRTLRSTKVLSSVECQQAVLSDISNVHFLESSCVSKDLAQHKVPRKQRKNDSPLRVGRYVRKSQSSPKEERAENCFRPDAVTETRRIDLVRQPSSCTTIGRKRVVGVDGESGAILEVPEMTRGFMRSDRSPEVYLSSPEFEASPRKRLASPTPPSTPATSKSFGASVITDESVYKGGDSLLEELPFDLLVRIVCCCQHDELKPVFQVCERLRDAVVIARQLHFNYTTPDRAKKERLGPLNLQHADNLLNQRGSEVALESLVCPPTPDAPRQLPISSQRRISDVDLQPFAPPLFQEAVVVFPNSGNFCRKSRPTVRGVPSHRVLFYEEELCQAVAQNTI